MNATDDELNGDADCSLREAIEAANTNAAVGGCAAGDAGPDTIVFDALLLNGTITLSMGEFAVTEPLTIDGSRLASGLYVVRIVGRGIIGTRKVTLFR